MNSHNIIWAIYDMYRFHAEAFLKVLSGLQELQLFLAGNFDSSAYVPADRKQGWHNHMKDILRASEEIGLRTVPSHLRGLLRGGPGTPITEEALRRGICSTHDCLMAELSHQLMLIVPRPDDDLLIGTGPAFDDEVYKAFPSARFDIDEAAKCLALDRSTACVLHLMRTLEAGLNALAKELHIPFEHKCWEEVLNKVPKRVAELNEEKIKPDGWKETRQFYAEAGAHLDLVRFAFRNWAMHLHETYDIPTARALFEHTKAFMRHLATKLSEPESE